MSLERRGLMGVLAGLGLAAASGTLGSSLLIRAGHAQHSGQVKTKTASGGQTSFLSFTREVPPTGTFVGTMTNTRDPGTWTETYTAPNPFTSSATATWPGPFGGSQTITLAISYWHSIDPGLSSTQTYSWNGTGYTMTSSRTPTSFSQSITDSLTWTYTTTTPGGQMVEDGVAPEALALDPQTPQVVHSVEARGLDVLDARSRQRAPTRVRFTHGRND